MRSIRRLSVAVTATLVLLLFSSPLLALEAVSFSKTFAPDTIGPGSVSTLEFDVTNQTSDTVVDMAFSDELPAGVTIADPASASSNCGAATLSASAGGSIIDFSDGSLGAGPGQSCKVTVNVTSSTPGVHTNESGDLTSSAGNSGIATADLTVATGRPGFSKSFSPSSVEAGQRSTLTFTIDNSLNANAVHSANFTDSLPSPMVIASPSNASTTCGAGILTANPGSSSVSFSAFVSIVPVVAATGSCTINVEVTAANKGMLDNVSEELITSYLNSPSVSSGKATATMDVNVGDIHLIKSFTDDPVGPGGTVTLEFSVFSRTRSETMNKIGFTDDLDAALTGLVATDLPKADVCGAGSSLSLTGTGSIELTGGSLGPGESCIFSTTLQVPAGTAPGGYFNVTSAITTGGQLTGNTASDTLFISDAPVLTKEFLSSTVGGGGSVTMKFTVSSVDAAEDIAFDDNLTAFVEGLMAGDVVALPAEDFCGTGSTLTASGGFNPPQQGFVPLVLHMSGGSLAAGDSCSFDMELTMPFGAAGGVATNTTSELTATINQATRTGSPASASLMIASTPRLTKQFTNDPVDPGGIVTLEFQIAHAPEATTDATAITFSDDLESTGITGLAALALPLNDVCGAGSVVDGTTVVTLTGGTLTPGSSCIFLVDVLVPAAVFPGAYENTAGPLTAMVDGVETTGVATVANLHITGLDLSKNFTDDPAIPGDIVTLQFTLDNTSPVDATEILFTDDLDETLDGLLPLLPLPVDPCGAGSSITTTGPDTLEFQDDLLAAGTSCTFSVPLTVPAGAANGSYRNTTSPLYATMEGDDLNLDPASDRLVVSSELLNASKSFGQDSVAPGGTIGLTFTVNNISATNDVMDIAFSDDLDAALSGLLATGLPANDVCGTGSTVSGTDIVSLAGGSLPAGGQCQFTVILSVPGDAPSGTQVNNTTSTVSGMVGNFAVDGEPASDSFKIDGVEFSKSFAAGDTFPGDTTTLTFVIDNLGEAIDRLAFSDDLDAMLSGAMASGLPLTDICGPGSSITGTSVLVFTGSILGAGESCTFDIPVLIPGDAGAPGEYLNVTSELTNAGDARVAPAATATLYLVPATTIVCHKPGTRAEKTLEIPITSLRGHLRHGDYEGPCLEPIQKRGKKKRGKKKKKDRKK